MDASSGNLSLAKPLDREESPTMTLVVKVTSTEEDPNLNDVQFSLEDETLQEVTINASLYFKIAQPRVFSAIQ